MGCGSSVQSLQSRSAAPSNNEVPLLGTVPPNTEVQSTAIGATQEIGTFEPFTEFPTPKLLRDANEKYATLRRPLPRDATGELLPYPTPTTKASVFDSKRFHAVDKFAVEVQPTKYNLSLKDFTDHLTATWKNDQMATARVIIRWLAAQRPDELKQLNCLDENSTLAKLQTESETNIFLEMCLCAGLQAKKIVGYAKHARLEIGEEPTSDDLHSWVALVINQEWRVVDPHWCSSSVTGLGSAGWSLVAHDVGAGASTSEEEEERMVYILDEYYFLPNPEEFIFSHFPRDGEAWQFLARPITFREFVDLAYLKPTFFELDLRLLEHRKCVLYAPEGEIEIKIGIPPNARREFRYQLWMSNRQEIENVKIERYCLMEQKNDTLICRIRFPVDGKFKHKLFGRSAELGEYDSFGMLCAFIIHCEKPAEDAKALPENTRQEWGPGKDLADAGLVPVTHQDAVIEANQGAVEVRFQSTKPVDLRHTLHSDNKTKEDLQGNVVHYMENDEVVFNIQLPEDGDYALNLYSKDEGHEKSLCSYVVNSTNTVPDNQGFAVVPDGRIGLSANNDIGIKLISHNSPIIECSEGGCLELKFKTLQLYETLPKLELVTEEGNILKEGFVWTEFDDKNNEITFKVNFPESGRYVFNLHAKEEGKDGSLPLAYTCVVKVPTPKQACVSFPERCSSWGRQYKLVEPVTNVLPSESTVRFVVEVPDAHQVSVFSTPNDRTSLKRNNRGLWEADVATGEGDHELELKAEIKKDSNSYTPLLKYQVEESEELKKEKELQRQREEAARREEEARKEELRKQIEKEKELQRQREEAARREEEARKEEIRKQIEKEKELQQQKEEAARREEEAKKEKMRKQIEKAKQELQDAMDSRDVKALRAAILKMENSHFIFSFMSEEVEAAKRLLKRLERIEALKEAFLKLDQKTMLELKNYSKPPKLVHRVIKAALLLLGDDETKTAKWTECQKRLVTIGKDGLFRRVRAFDVTCFDAEQASQALNLIGNCRREEAAFVCTGAEVFYSWTVGMIEEFRQANPSMECKTPPVISATQKDI